MHNSQSSKIWAALCYCPPLFAILLFVKRRDHLTFFHAKQALGAWSILLLGYVLTLLPGQFLGVVKWPICLSLGILFLLHLVDGIIKAAKGSAKPLSPVGTYIDGLAVFQKIPSNRT